MDVDMMNEVDVITQDQIAEQEKAERDAQVVDEGTYEGLVFYWNKVEESEKGEKNAFRGIPQYKVGITLFDYQEAGKKRNVFFSMTPHKVVNPDSGKPKTAYTTLVGLTKALQCGGKSVGDTLDQAKVTRLKYRVGRFEGDNGPGNYLKSVSAL